VAVRLAHLAATRHERLSRISIECLRDQSQMPSRTFRIVLTLTAAVVLALVWSLVRDRRVQPYHVDRGALSGWTVVLGAADDPWVVALQPPPALTTSLFRQVTAKVDRPLVAPRHAVLPLVMQPEYADALQGVYGAMDIQRIARQAIVAESPFEPICIGRRVDPRPDAAPRELYFMAVKSPAFDALRIDLLPDFPEHAGIGFYDPGALTAVLPIAATDTDMHGWWPIRLERIVDCQAEVIIE